MTTKYNTVAWLPLVEDENSTPNRKETWEPAAAGLHVDVSNALDKIKTVVHTEDE